MAESIPISPDSGLPSDDELDAIASGENGSSFDDDILADIERSLDDEVNLKSGGLGEKVELDKADLPLIWDDEEEEEEEPAEVEVDLAPPEEPEALDLEQEQGGRGLKFWLMLGGGVLVSLVLGLVMAWYMGAFDAKPQEPEVAKSLPPNMFQGKVPDPVAGLQLELKPFTVPLIRSKKGRILTVVVSLEVTEPDQKQKLQTRERFMRDVVYRLMRERPADELDAARQQMLLNAQVKAVLNQALGGSMIYKVYFTHFVITG